jgi:RNA polymerase sigma factor (TIGR02999 family)
MGSDTGSDITELLQAWSGGDPAALERLVPLVARELRLIAKRYLERESPDASLVTASLVNEAYVRLLGARQVAWKDHAHFFAVCAQIMRRILVDYARARRSAKRGAGMRPIPLDEALVVSQERAADLVALDEALEALSNEAPRKGRVVELRFFGGLSVEQTAAVLGISVESVTRDWRLAKAWLLRELSREGPHGPGTMATDRPAV